MGYNQSIRYNYCYLGKYDLVHIVPNKNLQAARPFIHQIKICEEGLFHIKSL
jgi:hypothetical protein